MLLAHSSLSVRYNQVPGEMTLEETEKHLTIFIGLAVTYYYINECGMVFDN